LEKKLDVPQDKQRRPGEGSKVAGGGWNIPSQELHHWWPRGLSKLWADHDGLTSRLSASGEILRSKPKNFGALKNAHAIKLEGPWNATIEPIFNFADSNLPRLVTSILEMHSVGRPFGASGVGQSQNRIRVYQIASQDRDAFSEGLASLVLRSPAFRHRIRSTINPYRTGFGQPDIHERDNLIAGNIHQWYSNAVSDFRRAYMGLLYSRTKEFIFGEGYLNNVSGPTYTSNLRAVLPLTPELAIISFSGSGSSPPSEVCSFAVTDVEASAINELTQVYTRDYVYFRSQQPAILDAFAQNEFLERPYHEDAMIESIISEVRNARQRK
jgi:Protein of unknown function (DUF4238)